MTEYRRCQGKSYMILGVDEVVKGYECPMLAENKIIGLLPLQITNEEGKTQFWYDISGRQSLEDWMRLKKTGSSFLKTLFGALADTILRMGDYLLCEDGLLLSPEQIFVGFEGKEILFCYAPFEKTTFAKSLQGFMEYYLSHMQHGKEEGTQKCYEVYERCQQENVALEELLEILLEEEVTREEPIEQERYEYEENEKEGLKKRKNRFYENGWKEKLFLRNQKRCERIKKYPAGIPLCTKRCARIKKADQPYVFEPEEEQTENAHPTVFLGSEIKQIIGELRYEGDGTEENLKITAPVFLIGSQRDEVEGVINNDTISRIHARITKVEEDWYLEDMNSTNGTYHNGTLLNYKEKVMLQKNDRIVFAGERYRFV